MSLRVTSMCLLNYYSFFLPLVTLKVANAMYSFLDTLHFDGFGRCWIILKLYTFFLDYKKEGF